LYKHFDYFYIDKQITGTGRIQEKPHLISNQTNKFARPFIKYYTEYKKVNEFTFPYIKEILSKNLNTINEKIEHLSYETFENETNRLQDEYLLHFFKDNSQTKEDLLKLNSVAIDDVLDKLKPAQALSVLSLIHYLINKNNSYEKGTYYFCRQYYERNTALEYYNKR